MSFRPMHRFLRSGDSPQCAVEGCSAPRDSHIGRATSHVTSMVNIPCNYAWGFDQSLCLYDGAEAVPVTSRDEPLVHNTATWVGVDGQLWMTYCCCGPAAPLPMAYRETVHQNAGQYVFTYEQRDAKRVRTRRQFAPAEMVERAGMEILRERLRWEYAYQVEREGL